MDNITVHDDLKEAVDASALVAMVVVADRNLQAATSIINSVPPTSWKDKTLIQYTTHEPTSIVAQERLMESLGAKLVGGQIVGELNFFQKLTV
jgi:3-hydroxyisobutyrate dehydrogenase-like beta-hydroxyacid dehydrogenase